MSKRIKHSFGKCHFNDGAPLDIKHERYKLDYSRRFYLFDVIPMGAVRMSSSDRWKTDPNHANPDRRQRPAVTQYFAFKDAIREQAEKMNFQLGKCVEMVFLCPMPDSWSEKKKELMNGMPNEVKPDFDNVAKGAVDALKKNDSDIWYGKIHKYWAYRGSIIIFQ